MGPLILNIEAATRNNVFYRHVIYTSKYLQLVLMCLLPGEDIPLETHNGEQFIRIESGQGIVQIDGQETVIFDGASINIPEGAAHYLLNNGNVPLKLYTIYSPPEHSPTRKEYTNPQTRERIIISG